jgi:AdoMet-dependent heme synthase
MDKIVSRMENWIKGKNDSPSEVQFNFSYGCNQNCKFCNMHNGKEGPLGKYNIKEKLSGSDYYRVIDECAKLGVEQIQLSGDGEPLYNKKVSINIMKKIKKHDIYGFINTNGVLFSEKDIKMLVKNKWDRILFSIEGPDAATHDYLVNVPGSFKKVIHNIKRFNFWKEKLKTDKPEMEIKMVLTNRNYDKIEKMVSFSQKLKIHLWLDKLIIFNNVVKKLELNEKQKKEFRKYLEKAIELSKNSNIRFRVSDAILQDICNNNITKEEGNITKKIDKKNKYLSSPCYMPWLRLLIDTRGYVGSCGFCISKDNVKDKSVREIWLGKAYRELRNDILNKRLRKGCEICCDIEFNNNIRNALNQKKPK